MKKLVASLLGMLSLSTIARAETLTNTPAPYVLVPPAETRQVLERKARGARAEVIVGAVLLGAGLVAGGASLGIGLQKRHDAGSDSDFDGFVEQVSGIAVLVATSIPGTICLTDGLVEGKQARVQLTSAGIAHVQGGAVAHVGIKF